MKSRALLLLEAAGQQLNQCGNLSMEGRPDWCMWYDQECKYVHDKDARSCPQYKELFNYCKYLNDTYVTKEGKTLHHACVLWNIECPYIYYWEAQRDCNSAVFSGDLRRLGLDITTDMVKGAKPDMYDQIGKAPWYENPERWDLTKYAQVFHNKDKAEKWADRFMSKGAEKVTTRAGIDPDEVSDYLRGGIKSGYSYKGLLDVELNAIMKDFLERIYDQVRKDYPNKPQVIMLLTLQAILGGLDKIVKNFKWPYYDQVNAAIDQVEKNKEIRKLGNYAKYIGIEDKRMRKSYILYFNKLANEIWPEEVRKRG